MSHEYTVKVGNYTNTFEADSEREALQIWAEQHFEPGFTIEPGGYAGSGSYIIRAQTGGTHRAVVHKIESGSASAEVPEVPKGRKPRQPKAATAKLVLLYAKLLTVRRMRGPYRKEQQFATQFEDHRQKMEDKYGHLYDLRSGTFMENLKREAEKEIIKHPMWGPGSLW